MSTHNICFCEKIRKISVLFGLKTASYEELCSLSMNFLAILERSLFCPFFFFFFFMC